MAHLKLFDKVRSIIESAKAGAARSVNSAQVAAYWLIGREIIEEEQKGRRRAEYGKQILEDLALRLTADYGRGFSIQNLRYLRQFFLRYPRLITGEKIRQPLVGELDKHFSHPEIRQSLVSE